jgi:hypothetical protein
MDEVEFEKWYQLYPRKEHRIAAQKAWNKFNPSPATIAKMTADLDRYRGVAWERIPHPASYINGRRWEDERANHSQLPAAGGRVRDLQVAHREALELSPEQRRENQAKLRAIAASIQVRSI